MKNNHAKLLPPFALRAAAAGFACLVATTSLAQGTLGQGIHPPFHLQYGLAIAGSAGAAVGTTVSRFADFKLKIRQAALRGRDAARDALRHLPTPSPAPIPTPAPTLVAVANDAKVFASYPIPFKAGPSYAVWQRIYPAITSNELFDCGGKSDCSSTSRMLAQTVDRVKSLPLDRQLSEINGAVNALVRYVPDSDNYRELDYWALPREIIASQRGDCEDYAILKMAALHAAGIPSESMSLVVLRDNRRKLLHAVLSVSTSKGYYVLDNLRNDVAKDTALGDYQPLYSMSTNKSWLHGVKRSNGLMASASGSSLNLAPGTGTE